MSDFVSTPPSNSLTGMVHVTTHSPRRWAPWYKMWPMKKSRRLPTI